MKTAMGVLPLIRQSLAEHEALINEAGVPELLRKSGWIKLFPERGDTGQGAMPISSGRADLASKVTSSMPRRLRHASRTERRFAGAVYLSPPGLIPDPGGLAKAYAALFKRKGGRFLVGDARRSNRTAVDGASAAGGAAARGRRWWRLGPGRIWSLLRSAIRSRSRSSAATICTSRRVATRSSIIPCWIPTWASAGADEPRHSPHHRRRVARRDAPPTPVQLHGRCRWHMRCFRSASRSTPSLDGRAAVPARHDPVIGRAPRLPAVVRFRPPAPWPDARPGHGRRWRR